jgi:hypothetical protein
VDYLTDEQCSYGDKEPVELGADLQFGPLATPISAKAEMGVIEGAKKM